MPSDLDRLVGIARIIDATSGSDVLMQPMRKALRLKGPGFIITPQDDAIQIELDGSAGAKGPTGDKGATGNTGPNGSLATIGRLDATFSPVVLWSLDGVLTDSSGNARTATVDTGTIVYCELWPGYRGASFQSLRLKLTNAAAQITGDVTVEGVFMFDAAPNGSTLFCHAGPFSSEASGDNFLYSTQVNATRLPNFLSESGSGTDATFTGATTCYPAPGVPFHFAMTRISNVIRYYCNGVLLGAASGTLTAPTGGASGSLYLGGHSASLHPNFLVADFKVIAAGLVGSDVLAESNRSIGALY